MSTTPTLSPRISFIDKKEDKKDKVEEEDSGKVKFSKKKSSNYKELPHHKLTTNDVELPSILLFSKSKKFAIKICEFGIDKGKDKFIIGFVEKGFSIETLMQNKELNLFCYLPLLGETTTALGPSYLSSKKEVKKFDLKKGDVLGNIKLLNC
jgi:hypothetical protein